MVSKWTTLEDSWKVLDSLADPYVGIVRREYRKLRDVDDVWGHSYGAHGTDSEILFGIPSNSYNGGGSDNPGAARLAAIGKQWKDIVRLICHWIPMLYVLDHKRN